MKLLGINTRMLTLYYRPTCPFCRRVLAVIDRLGIQVELVNILEGDNQAKLVALGGKPQVPYLIDTEKNLSMYESDDIVTHLQTHYGNTAAAPARPRVHISDNACVSCEG